MQSALCALISALAAFGFFCLIKIIFRALFMSNRICVAIRINKPSDLDHLDIILHGAGLASLDLKKMKTLLIISEDAFCELSTKGDISRYLDGFELVVVKGVWKS